MHHGRSRKQVVHVVHTKYEVNPSIIRDCRPIQTSAVENLVFDPLTTAVAHMLQSIPHMTENTVLESDIT